jgi:hypothetical protein
MYHNESVTDIPYINNKMLSMEDNDPRIPLFLQNKRQVNMTKVQHECNC